MAEENPKEFFQGVKQLSANDKIREALDPVKCVTEAAQLRTQADRISAAARELAASRKETDGAMSALGGAKGTFGPMEGGYRGISGMLAGLAEKELAANFTLTIPADRLYAEAHFWRSRVLADMLAASSYYKASAELISLAMKTLDKCSPSVRPGGIVLLLDHASTLLVDAAKFMATAGAELGDNAVRWKTLEEAVRQL
jgi:hypothetical protein